MAKPLISKVFIGNLPTNFHSERLAADLVVAFRQCGYIYREDVQLPRDPETGRMKGFGFLSFETMKAANNALALDGFELHGREIRISLAKDKETRRQERRSSGGYRGRGRQSSGRNYNNRDRQTERA